MEIDYLELSMKKGIDSTGIIRTKDIPTIVKRRILAGNQQLLRIDWEKAEPISKELEDLLLENFNSKIDSLDAIILLTMIREYLLQE